MNPGKLWILLDLELELVCGLAYSIKKAPYQYSEKLRRYVFSCRMGVRLLHKETLNRRGERVLRAGFSENRVLKSGKLAFK